MKQLIQFFHRLHRKSRLNPWAQPVRTVSFNRSKEHIGKSNL